MRTLLTFAALLAAAPAFAGSFEPVSGTTTAGSIETVSCDDCPALKPKREASTYHVDAIDPGTQKVEIREANGERKIYRTEAWMGGSPVLFVSKAPAETVQAADAAAPADDTTVTVDATAKTSALDSGAARDAKTATVASSQEFDPAGFELRVN
ncbi:plant virulence effector HPE1-like domain-containing protein [Shinella sp.]|uniref:plant virulence effector HPE1-like domain-containing protein n=1 Tax=Shinella sp. TaxID=1870904 RepID=UPI0028AC6454|nr:plant virulence effector HPE1-like domain-containing protein [Shinella sp.]